MRATGLTRAGRPPASTSWLLVLTGLSCTYTYHVGLPGPVGDAGGNSDETGGAQASDASLDQSSPSDRSGFNRPDECANFRHLNVQQNQVEMIVALDRSTSMQKNAFDSTTRLQAAQTALLESIRAHPSIQFGIEQFPSARDCNGATCCADWVSVPPAPYHATSIQEQMACGSGDPDCTVASSDSPSHLALQKCRVWFTSEGQGSSSQFVLLVTDQDPTCAGDASTDASLCSLAGDEAARLKKIGVQVFVVSLNNDAQSTGCLASLAAASPSTSAGNSQFVAATEQADLKGKLEAIMTAVEVNVCRFSLVNPPDNPGQVVVSVNHQRLQRDPSGPQGGWRFSDATSSEVVLSGSYCAALTSGQDDTTPWVLDCGQ